ncbi:hypothetical protein [Lysobacter niastensis]|nr:hypothetical protein [Lysobacter niastensis]
MNPTIDPRNDDAARRKAARRTALWVAVVAVAIYVIFITSGILSK